MGKYVDSNLVNGEVVVYEAKYHWIYLGINVVIAVLFCWLILPLFSLAWMYLRIKTDEFVITNKRLIIKTGIISRQTMELQLSKVETVNIKQGIFGRMIGYGTIIASGTGGSYRAISMISEPNEFRKAFLNACEQLH